jgi:hypothetical protein
VALPDHARDRGAGAFARRRRAAGAAGRMDRAAAGAGAALRRAQLLPVPAGALVLVQPRLLPDLVCAVRARGGRCAAAGAGGAPRSLGLGPAGCGVAAAGAALAMGDPGRRPGCRLRLRGQCRAAAHGRDRAPLRPPDAAQMARVLDYCRVDLLDSTPTRKPHPTTSTSRAPGSCRSTTTRALPPGSAIASNPTAKPCPPPATKRRAWTTDIPAASCTRRWNWANR